MSEQTKDEAIEEPRSARDLFSDAYDEELSAEEQAEFEAALADAPDLAEEFAEFAAVLDGARAMHTGGDAPPDMLKGIQRRIRERTNGRFFRDRYEKKKPRGVGWSALLVVAILIMLAIAAYMGLSYLQAAEGAR
ncbi:MAG: hypothetical protein AAF411_01170 [Myxococcota bacterium]